MKIVVAAVGVLIIAALAVFVFLRIGNSSSASRELQSTTASQSTPASSALGTSDEGAWLSKFPHATSTLPLTYYEIPETSGGKTITLYAWLQKPAGNGPFPTIILLHGCNGLFGTAPDGIFIGAWPQYQFWSTWLVSKGYATLILDSYTGRGINIVCGGLQMLSTSVRAVDVYTAATYLVQHVPAVNPQKLGVLGDSHGAGTTVEADNVNNTDTTAARAALSAAGGKIDAFAGLYVGCAGMPQKQFSAPLLLLLGSADDWTPPTVCEQLINYPAVTPPTTINDLGAPVTIMVYPGATHAFDVQGPPTVTPAGYHLEYDPTATADAQQKILQFFSQYLGN